VLGIAATISLVGRRLLVPPLLLGAAAWSAAFIVIGLAPSEAGAFGLLAVAGTGRALFDVAGRTLLQRVAPPDLLARVFGVLESLSMAGLAVGSLLGPALVAIGGARAAFLAVGTLLPALALLCGRQLLRVDRAADVPVVEIALLRSLPTMAPLEPPELERLARCLTAHPVKRDEVVVREGEPGKQFFVVADGELEVMAGGSLVPPLGRGDGFGEIALLEDCARTATVTARSDGLLYALERDDFLSAVSANAESAREARQIVDERQGRGARNPRTGGVHR
jgi:MFS family permease